MKYFTKQTATMPFWKVRGKYVTLEEIAGNPDIRIDFPDGPDEILKEVVLHRLNSQREGIEHEFGMGEKTLRYEHTALIQQVAQETPDGIYYLRVELMTMKVLYADLMEGNWGIQQS